MPTTENGSMWPHCRPEPYGYNHHLAAWHGCQSSRSTFRPFGIPTLVKHRRHELLDIDAPAYKYNNSTTSTDPTFTSVSITTQSFNARLSCWRFHGRFFVGDFVRFCSQISGSHLHQILGGHRRCSKRTFKISDNVDWVDSLRNQRPEHFKNDLDGKSRQNYWFLHPLQILPSLP